VGNRTLISRQGREYRKAICELVQVGATLDTRLAVEIAAHPPDRRRRDLDNIQKPVLDALEHTSIYADDSQIDLLLTRRRDVVPSGCLHVDVLTLPLRRCPLCGGTHMPGGGP
jgi:crossover junction endodeoxyribonuclease RusA